MKMELAHDEITEYKLNSPYNNMYHKKLICCDGGYAYEENIMNVVVQRTTKYFHYGEYSMKKVEKLQHLLLSSWLVGVLVSPYVIREICKLYRII